MLDSLRVEVDSRVLPFNPYLYQGTLGSWDERELRRAFARASFIEVGERRPIQDTPLPIIGLSVGGLHGPNFNGPIGFVDPHTISLPLMSDETWSLKVTKVGLLYRKRW